jgi:hypothetical protein
MDEGDVQPRAFVAHAQMQDLLLVALISTHPDPEGVMRQFRGLIDHLAPIESSNEPFLAGVRRSAVRFDRMVQRLLPATDAHRVIGSSKSTPSGGS